MSAHHPLKSVLAILDAEIKFIEDNEGVNAGDLRIARDVVSELLEALLVAECHMSTRYRSDSDRKYAIKCARAAIAKATGAETIAQTIKRQAALLEARDGTQ